MSSIAIHFRLIIRIPNEITHVSRYTLMQKVIVQIVEWQYPSTISFQSMETFLHHFRGEDMLHQPADFRLGSSMISSNSSSSNDSPLYQFCFQLLSSWYFYSFNYNSGFVYSHLQISYACRTQTVLANNISENGFHECHSASV